MILSATCLKNSIDSYNQQSQENYKGDAKMRGRCLACLVVAIIILVIEIAVLYYALDIAINTTKAGAERFIHVVLAVVFTMPYLLFSLLLNPKASALLTGASTASPKFRMRGGKCGM